jgi:hypothetical protein
MGCQDPDTSAAGEVRKVDRYFRPIFDSHAVVAAIHEGMRVSSPTDIAFTHLIVYFSRAGNSTPVRGDVSARSSTECGCWDPETFTETGAGHEPERHGNDPQNTRELAQKGREPAYLWPELSEFWSE